MGWGIWRRYDLSPAMVRAATDRRRVGDWRGSCAAAGIAVDPALTAADRPDLADDLRHLVPDLVRWHLLDADQRLTTGLPVVLARYGRHALVVDAGPVLALRSSEPGDGGHFSRCYWDARHTDRLRARLGGSDRTPFFHSDGLPLFESELPRALPPVGDRAALTEWECRLPPDDWRTAWRAADVELGPEVDDVLATGHYRAGRWSHMVPAARDLLVAGTGQPHGTVHFPWEVEWWPNEYIRLGLTLRPDARPLLHMAESVTTFTTAGGVSRYVERRPELPASGQEDPWFLPPLRTGALAPDGLHPLVQEALFPNRPAQPYRRPPGVPVPDRIAVACAGRRHHVGFRGGHLVLLSHGPDEFRREQVLTALTAQASGCFEVLRNWTAGTGWLPDHLWALAEHRVLAARGGDTAEVARLA